MYYSNNISVLVADQDSVSRQHMSNILGSMGYDVLQALDGANAIRIVNERNVDVAIVSQIMSPNDGFDFARHVIDKGLKIGMIMIADDTTTDLLLEASKYEIAQVIRRPVDPDRLNETVRRTLRAVGKYPDAIAGRGEPSYSAQELMARAIALAQQNARSKMGGPFGAVVATLEGKILGEGVNSVTSRCDPTAHAEVMAIRQCLVRLL
jgi:DNA-binding NtrC family response regulator